MTHSSRGDGGPLAYKEYRHGDRLVDWKARETGLPGLRLVFRLRWRLTPPLPPLRKGERRGRRALSLPLSERESPSSPPLRRGGRGGGSEAIRTSPRIQSKIVACLTRQSLSLGRS